MKKGRHDSTYNLFPEADLKYSEDVISFAMKIRITLLMLVTGRCPIQLICVLEQEDGHRGENTVKEPEHCLSSSRPCGTPACVTRC